jgi:hypothetical protein
MQAPFGDGDALGRQRTVRLGRADGTAGERLARTWVGGGALRPASLFSEEAYSIQETPVAGTEPSGFSLLGIGRIIRGDDVPANDDHNRR